MQLSGKARPDTQIINSLVEEGFEHIELYLTTDILDNQDDIVEQCKRSDANIANVHTPHINIDSDTTEYYKQTDQIAAALNATLVVDSNPTSTRYTPNIYPIENVRAPSVGYENDPSVSSFYLQNNHLAKGKPLVLDTAHLHMSEESYIPFIESIIAQYGVDMIPSVHLDNATRTNDGTRAINEGTVDIPTIVKCLDAYDYGGTVVLEVPHAAQGDALKYVQEIVDTCSANKYENKY